MSIDYHKRNIDLLKNYLDVKDWRVKENSNMGFSLSGLNNYISTELTKNYWLYQIYDEEIRTAHRRGDIHINDLGSLSSYCIGWALDQLLDEGFCGVPGKIESSPPKHFRAALGQIVNFLFTTQNEHSGAQALNNFDTYLAPFIYYDKLTRREVKQALQEFVHNMNVSTRSGGQTAFTNITLDLNPSSVLKDNPVIIAGKPKDKVYGEFQKEINLLNDCLLEVMATGDKNGRVFTFPVITVNITSDFDWDNPHLKHFWDATMKYGLPNFSNFVTADINPEDIRSMCCRLRLDEKELHKRAGGLFGAGSMTGSIGVCTLNLNRIGYLAKSESDFFDRLEKLLIIAKNSLEIKRQVVEECAEKQLYPYTTYYLRNFKKRFKQYFHTFFSTIGLVGMNDACMNFLGKDISHPECVELTQNVLKFINDKILEFQKETGNLYNCEQSPAEGASHSLALKDKKYYPNIYTNGSEDSPYLTNSTHLPVNYADDIFEVLDHQNEFVDYYTGGSVVHLFIGEKLDNVDTLKLLIKTICSNYKIPYFSLTPTFSICPQCGYLHGEHCKCSTCKSDCEVYSRVVGYLRPVSQWNAGKSEEFRNRNYLQIIRGHNTQ